MGWGLAVFVSLIAWAFYWPAGWLDDLLWVPVLVTAIAAGICALVYRSMRAKALAHAIAQHGARQPLDARPERHAGMQALQQQIKHGVAALKQSKLGGKTGTAALYSLPWYMIIGPPGAGKTTALKASGLPFPVSGADGGGVSGVGGTRNCDWWFTDDAILLDTAGRFTTEADDRNEWLAFLQLLKQYRSRRPINGVLVAISVTDLVDVNEEQIESYGKKIRGRIDEVMTQLQMVVPVYVLFTKMDLIAGFKEIFGDMKKSDRRQVWGATLDLSADTANPQALFDAEFEQLFKQVYERSLRRLMTRLLARSIREPDEKIYQFPLEFAGIRQRLGDFIGRVFTANSFQETPIFRGFYFTSGTQEGRPLDRVLHRMSEAMGVDPTEPQEPPRLQARSYFLHDVFTNVVFKDADVATRSAAEIRRQRHLRVATAAAVAMLSLIVCVMAVLSFVGNRSLLITSEGQVQAAQAISWKQPPSKNLALLEPILERLRELDRHREEGVPIGMGWMMYQGDRIHDPTAITYVAHLQQGFVVPCKQRLEERLKAVKGNEYLSERSDLKAYLMLDDSHEDFENLDIEWAMGQYTDLWFEHVKAIADKPEPDLKKQMAQHVRYYFTLLKEKRVAPLPLDQNLVADVREVLMSVPIARRYYDLYVNSVTDEKIDDSDGQSHVNRRRPTITLRDVFSDRPAVRTVLTSARFEKDQKWQEVEWPYTERGRYAVARNIAMGIGLLEQDAWVVPLGPDETANKVATNIRALANDYERRYIATWMAFLADVTVKSPETLPEAVHFYKILASTPWPYLQLLRGLEDHTQWPTTGSALSADWQKKATALANKRLKEKFGRKTGSLQLTPDFDIFRMGDRPSVIPALFRKTVGFGVPMGQNDGSQMGTLLATPLAKYISRLDALRNEMEKLLDANDKTPPYVMRTQLIDAAKEVEALVGAQLMAVPDPNYKDPARLLLRWLQSPLKVGDVRLPAPRLQ